ncbi:mRNA interferase MazF [Bradyrhizobium lablabi]|uniref:mRNA interferase MazF n=1 Tax=Bradyrhizobium lablabi TaxID=722472 RepID=A0A1M6QXJ5_9BRAD|nr:type II toxin-antitoxin system PemK/MazF family toxin [Bradyrhizobium lablabi]SHK24906.1 mRNA interferase MazF [Bradyrhizobium lablabi]
MNRGDIVAVALPGAYGKPRPAVIVQADRFNHLGSITFLPFTSDVLPAEIFRILINPSSENGLQSPSQVMADKCSTLPLTKVGNVFGRLGAADLGRVERALAAFLGFV